jgi:hypothetical protein
MQNRAVPLGRFKARNKWVEENYRDRGKRVPSMIAVSIEPLA